MPLTLPVGSTQAMATVLSLKINMKRRISLFRQGMIPILAYVPATA